MKEQACIRRGLSLLRNISRFWSVSHGDGRENFKLNRVHKESACLGSQLTRLPRNLQLSIPDMPTAKEAGKLWGLSTLELETVTLPIKSPKAEALTRVSQCVPQKRWVKQCRQWFHKILFGFAEHGHRFYLPLVRALCRAPGSSWGRAATDGSCPHGTSTESCTTATLFMTLHNVSLIFIDQLKCVRFFLATANYLRQCEQNSKKTIVLYRTISILYESYLAFLRWTTLELLTVLTVWDL